MDVLLPAGPPTRVYVRNGPRGILAIANLPEDATVALLKSALTERLMLKPGRRVVLYSWGRELEDAQLLSSYALPTNAQLDMKVEICHAPHDRGLRRVRITSTAIRTRQLTVNPTVSVLELKHRLHLHLMKADHEWFDHEGTCKRVRGATYLAVASVSADEKQGTAALKLGEELIFPASGGDKKGNVITVRRADKGTQINVLESSVLALDLPPQKQKLLWMGKTMLDQELLWELGVRTDDEIALEFESPTMPQVLQLMRAPAPEKSSKKEKKDKKDSSPGKSPKKSPKKSR